MVKIPARYPTRLGRKKISQEKLLLRKTLLQVVTLLGNAVFLLVKVLGGVLWLAKTIIKYILFYGFKLIIVPIYHLAKGQILKLKRFKNYWRQQFGKNFSRNIIIYGGLIVFSLFTTASNLKAREARPEEIGRSSGLYLLLQKNVDYEVIDSAGSPEERSNKPTSLAFSQIGIVSPVQPAGETEKEISQPLLNQEGDALLSPELTGSDLAPPARDKIITYVVQAEDTISQIAEKFEVSANTILWENKLGPRDFIKPGQELVILPVTGVAYTIQKGESLQAISQKFRAKLEDILEVNKLADADSIQVGTKIIIPDGIPPAPAVATRTRDTGLSNLLDIFRSAPPIAGQFYWPTNTRRISQYFRGWRHTGIDVPNKSGQPIYAAEDGIVVTSGWNRGGYGIYIIIDHGRGIQTLYAHNSKNLVSVGQRVQKGQVIALIGSTGRSTGPHVHFEVRSGGNRVNPLDYF